jgi:uncharacterized membrane protein YedE/YeeE
MKALKFIFTGILFGIVMTKSEAISWYRIQEMFRFQSFHMFGIIGTAVAIGIIFGLGWALTGACPGPMFINVGVGYLVMLLVIFGAVLGTYIYGILKDKLPH